MIDTFPTPEPASGLHLVGTAVTFMFHSFRRQDQPAPSITLGRDATCDIRITTDRSVSGIHARLEWGEDSIVVLIDSGSTNGVFVNSEPLADRVPLFVGSKVRLGRNTRFLTVDEDGLVPLHARSIGELCCLASNIYGSASEAARRFARGTPPHEVGREFVRTHAEEWRRNRWHGR